ncbi:hypothetical protein [Arthrobacter sp. C9C5]|uniref:hypothetical protein n=1 Tax=Arthrobacter sp. C9C5 TaxID=2735267 RepID=UPI0015854E51|nr:hypothetical protein [Arthrobacter sp. C9C5]NUU30485.1 hypothetical protein [Arthrobacter sp. C9C5]
MREENTHARVLWRALRERETFLAVLQHVAGEKGFKIISTVPGKIRLTVPASLLKRRRQTTLTGTVSHPGEPLEIAWPVSNRAQREHLLSLEENLPAGFMHYHGLIEAASQAGFILGSRAALRNVVDSLGRREVVTAAGRGQLGDAQVVVALTTQRILIVEGTALAPAHVDLPLGAIDRLTLGKKKTGETLGLASEEIDIVVSHLGHGEGHGIASSFRQTRKDMERTSPMHPHEPSRNIFVTQSRALPATTTLRRPPRRPNP